MLTAADIRRENLAVLVARFGGTEALVANAATRGVELDAVYLSQIKNRAIDKKSGKPRQMGDPLARKIEEGLAMERGWMDNVHESRDALARQLLDLYQALSIEGRHELLLRANERYNFEHPGVASPANPFAGVRPARARG